MIGNQLANIEYLESDLWDAADYLRTNSKLTAGEYCMPVLGVIFLRHATNRYNEALREIQKDQAMGRSPSVRSPTPISKSAGRCCCSRKRVTTNCSN